MAAILGGRTFDLAYLFEAHMRDGSCIKQTPEDRSTIDPEKRSAFYDVAQRVEDVLFFGLYNAEHTYVVDLRDGHFEIDGRPFCAQPVLSNCIPEGGTYRLVYFRDHQQDINVISGEMGEHRVAYRFGWQYEIEIGGVKKKWQQTIVVS